MKKNTIINALLAIAATAIITLLFPHPEANHYKFEEGRPWNYAKLIAPFDIPIRPDSSSVAAVRDSLDRTFAPVFTRNAEVGRDVIAQLMQSWATSSDAPLSKREQASRQRVVSMLRQAYNSDVIDDEYAERIAQGYMPHVRLLYGNTVRRIPTDQFTSPSRIMADLRSAFASDTALSASWLTDAGVAQTLKPSLVYESEMSDNLYREDLNQLNARMGTGISGVIQQGQTIIDKGAVISSQDYTNLLTYERMMDERQASEHGSRWLMWTGQTLYVLLIMGMLLVYLRFSSHSIWGRPRSMLFIFMLIALFFGITVLMSQLVGSGAYLAPFAIVPVLMVVFFDYTTAIFTSLTLVFVTAGALSFPLEYIILQVPATVAAVYSLRDISKRQQLLYTSLFVAASYLVGYLAIETMMNGSLTGVNWQMLGFLAISAALSLMSYILMVPVERLFGFVSPITLIELTDDKNPLLHELSEVCPGTYQHSIAVANLAADAAAKIGANDMLVRAGAMYHDIGKIANPNFYTENQRGVNPHDALPPEQSARIIISHVEAGVERARQAGLPESLMQFIRQHHGRGKAKYFYYSYCKTHGEGADPAPFTYPGPNPQTREASLLMMADSVEAASRSLPQHTPAAIEELVNKIIDSQIAEGLHNESTLMYRDVATIKETFIQRLMTIYHSRITYPQNAG